MRPEGGEGLLNDLKKHFHGKYPTFGVRPVPPHPPDLVTSQTRQRYPQNNRFCVRPFKPEKDRSFFVARCVLSRCPPGDHH